MDVLLVLLLQLLLLPVDKSKGQGILLFGRQEKGE
jgi:hypothetical protein